MSSTIYSHTLGLIFGSGEKAEAAVDEEVVSVEYLKRKAEGIIAWAASLNKSIFSER
jgi:hypothetical protein